MINKRSLRPRGQRLTLIVLVVLVGVAGGLAAVQAWRGARWWVSVVAVGLGAVVTGVGPLWQHWRERQAAAAAKVRRGVRGTGGRGGDRLPTVTEVDLRMLRVHPTVLHVPYLRRTAKEQEVRETLRAGRPVLLVGSSMVGKTRLAAAVVKELYPHRPILIPDTTTALTELDEADMLPGDHVIWLDDLDRYLSGGSLSAGLIMRLAGCNAVMATLRAREWDRFQPTDLLRPPEWDVLSVFAKVTLDRDRDRPSDEDLARAVPDDEVRNRIAQVGIGEYVGAGQHIIDQLALGAQCHPLGYALVLGAVDWRRTGVTRPVPADLLPALARPHLKSRQLATLADEEMYKDALAWATREVNPTVALLEPGDGVFTVYDFALDQLTTTADAPPRTTWQLVIDNAELAELVAIGYQAEITYKIHHIAERAWRRAAAKGHAGAMTNLGVLLQQGGNLSEAESWYLRAAEDGDTRAMNNLGVLLKQRGSITEAEIRYRRAAEDGDSDAMNNLGVLLKQCGNLAEAETWYRQAAKNNNAEAMFNLGLLLDQRANPAEEIEAWGRYTQLSGSVGGSAGPGPTERLLQRAKQLEQGGNLTEAENLYGQAAENGDRCAMYHFGVLLKQRGDLTNAEIWYRRAAKPGDWGVPHGQRDDDHRAMNNLGVLLKQRGNLTEAETWYRRAAAYGDTTAMANLGLLLKQRGDLTEAETWYRRAATYNRDARFSLGLLLERRGDLTEAETWYRKSGKDGDGDATINILRQGENLAEAETWYRRAAEAGHTDAMSNLGLLLHQCGNLTEAETWYRRAAEDPCQTTAMKNLGNLLNQRGELAEAETWYQREGNSRAMFNLARQHHRRGELAEAETWYRRAAADPCQTDAMNLLGWLLQEGGNLTEAETWYRQAAEDPCQTDAMNLLGWLLQHRRDAEAWSWYFRAAEGGNSHAMYNLGLLYQQSKDQYSVDQAEHWYRRAADTGHTEAMSKLAALLKKRGNITEAQDWYRKADSTST